MTAPRCPTCGNEAKQSDTRFGVRHDCCGLWSWDGAPLVDAVTHEARKDAHTSFDAIWKDGLLSRGDAYRTLAARLGLSRGKCHIKLMSADVARQVPPIVSSLRKELEGRAS